MMQKQVEEQQVFLMNNFGVYYLGDEKHVVVPEEIDGKRVTMIGHEGFSNKSMQSIELPATLIEIGSSAFRNCTALKSIQIPTSVERIAGGAFQGCHALKDIILHDNITEIGSYAFDECLALQSITLPKKLDYIGAYAFSDTPLLEVILPEGIEHLANSLFFNCQRLTKVSFPSTLQVIGNCAFAGCISLTSISFPAQLHTIREGAFEFCRQLTSVTFRGPLKIVDNTIFVDCPAIQYVTAPFEETALLELYDAQREIYKNDAVKLAALPIQQLPAIHLFSTIKPITWKLIAAPIEINEEIQLVDYIEQTMLAIQHKDYANAFLCIQMYVALYPDELSIYVLKGKIHYVQGHLEQSLLAYREALCDEVDASIYVHIGHALLDSEKIDNEVAQYKERIWTYTAENAYDEQCIAIAKKALFLRG